MALLQEKDREALKKLGSALTKDVDVTLYTQRASPLVVPGVIPCETCELAERLLTEMGEIIPRLKVDIVDIVQNREEAERAKAVRVPTIVLGGAAQKRARFVGFPGGYEASTFIKALLDAGGAAIDGLPQDIQKSIEPVDKAVEIKVFATPS